jgi:capsular polysaccharide biosynthesis protein
MATDQETTRARADEAPVRVRGVPELEEEREIDFAGLARKVGMRWWLVAAAVALGGIIGYLTSLGGGDVWVARTTLYLGQPVSPTGNVQIPSLATNPSTVNEIVRSDEVVQDVAREIGVRPGALRRGISTKTVSATGQTTARQQQQNPLVQISVRGPWGPRTAEAANLVAAAVVDDVSGYVDAKVDALEERLAAQNRELEQINARIEAHQRAMAQPGLSRLERLTLLNLMGLAEQRRGIVIEDRTDTEQLLTLAEEVERAAVITEARASRVPAQSPRSAIFVGALIGLLAGLALALVWEPLLGRRRLRTA